MVDDESGAVALLVVESAKAEWHIPRRKNALAAILCAFTFIFPDSPHFSYRTFFGPTKGAPHLLVDSSLKTLSRKSLSTHFS